MSSSSPPFAPPPSGAGQPTGPGIRKTPFVAYTVVGVATIYLMVAPTSFREFLLATLIAGLVLVIGGMAWLAAR
jgi:hypothetical protein